MRNLFRTTALAAAFTLGVIGFGGSAKAADNSTFKTSELNIKVGAVFDNDGNIIGANCNLSSSEMTVKKDRPSLLIFMHKNIGQSGGSACPSGLIVLNEHDAGFEAIRTLISKHLAVLSIVDHKVGQ